jgi:dTDP-glucose 4,6-dehydratase
VKNYLVTGGAGFIGSNFIHLLLKKYSDTITIHNIDSLTYSGNLENLKEIESLPNYFFHKVNITDYEALDKVFQDNKIDIIFNFAAESHVDRSILGCKEFIHTNIDGTRVLLDLARKYEIEKFIQISTDEVYGSLGDEGAFTENSYIKPNSPYSASKASADLLVRSYVKTYDFPAIITRCSNNYGPYQFPEKLIPLIVSNALKNKPLPVYGQGLNVRDWIYVEDHCKAIELVSRKGNFGEIYNIGGNAEKQNIEVVKTILERLNKPESLIQFVKDRPGHDFRYAIDFSKIQTELGWQPEVDFKEGIEKTIDWYLANQIWIENVITKEYLKYYSLQYKNS